MCEFFVADFLKESLDGGNKAERPARSARRPPGDRHALLVHDDGLEVPADVFPAAFRLERLEERRGKDTVDIALLSQRHGGGDGVAVPGAHVLDAVYDFGVIAGLLTAKLVATERWGRAKHEGISMSSSLRFVTLKKILTVAR